MKRVMGKKYKMRTINNSFGQDDGKPALLCKSRRLRDLFRRPAYRAASAPGRPSKAECFGANRNKGGSSAATQHRGMRQATAVSANGNPNRGLV